MNVINKNFDAKLEVKSLDGENSYKGIPSYLFTGYATTTDIDRTGDIVQAGAFSEDLQKNGNVRQLYYDHDTWGEKPMGEVVLEERPDGLYVKEGAIYKTYKDAAHLASLMQAGTISKMSIGFIPDDEYTTVENGIRKFGKARLREVSLVANPANLEAEVESFKNMEESGVFVNSIENLPTEFVDRGCWKSGEESYQIEKEDYPKTHICKELQVAIKSEKEYIVDVAALNECRAKFLRNKDEFIKSYGREDSDKIYGVIQYLYKLYDKNNAEIFKTDDHGREKLSISEARNLNKSTLQYMIRKCTPSKSCAEFLVKSRDNTDMINVADSADTTSAVVGESITHVDECTDFLKSFNQTFKQGVKKDARDGREEG